jgi:hypothetical protein
MRPVIEPNPEKFRRCVYGGIKPIPRDVWDEAMRITRQSERQGYDNRPQNGNGNGQHYTQAR